MTQQLRMEVSGKEASSDLPVPPAGWKKDTDVGVGERPSTNTLGDSQKEHKGNVKGKQDLPVV